MASGDGAPPRFSFQSVLRSKNMLEVYCKLLCVSPPLVPAFDICA